MSKVNREDEIAVARFQRQLRRAASDLSSSLGMRSKDLPHIQSIVLIAMLAAWHDGRKYEHEKNTLSRKPARPYDYTPLEAKLPDGVFDADAKLTSADKTPVHNVWDHSRTKKR